MNFYSTSTGEIGDLLIKCDQLFDGIQPFFLSQDFQRTWVLSLLTQVERSLIVSALESDKNIFDTALEEELINEKTKAILDKLFRYHDL